jgi:MFS transporter, DHA1 family, multidrug resistance protein
MPSDQSLAQSQPGPDPAQRPAVDWRLNLAALWACQFTALFGITAVYPFIAIFLSRDLGVRSTGSLAFWAGLCTAVAPLGIAVASPLWGVLADRVGRRPMLLRALLGGATVMALTAFCQNPVQFLLLRIAYGVLGGQRTLSISLVATETPRQHMVRAQGLLSMAGSLGGALGPAAAGLLAQLVGIRATIAAAGALFLAASAAVFRWVRETPLPRRDPGGKQQIPGWRSLPLEVQPVILVVFASQAVQLAGATMVVPLLAIRILTVDPRHAGVTTGIAFAVSGATTAFAALALDPVVRSLRYRWALAVAMTLSALCAIAIQLAPSTPFMVAAAAAYGLASGFLLPGTSSLLGILSPNAMAGRIFGLSSTAQSTGGTAGPLLAGLVAALAGINVALLMVAAVFAAGAVLVSVGVREPKPA